MTHSHLGDVNDYKGYSVKWLENNIGTIPKMPCQSYGSLTDVSGFKITVNQLFFRVKRFCVQVSSN